ncbi:trihelix transcription factor GT-1-like isoform X2 [Diospyros lotus]|uniref:trihelix transcription factor GT-1-like isoform X2 n=1 Tax=Diospyros lotus TaxID=55363 RepID=UPI00225518BD|nr:trihelix transcription factor GT-1-like isoform X2 [Diospyros lotus]
MYLSEKPLPVDFCREGGNRGMVIGVPSNVELPASNFNHHHQQQDQMILGDSGGEDAEMRAPKKRAETWVHEETRSLIAFRREVDSLFNTSKSNKHLWHQISTKMKDKGFDRSATMCTDKWRNLLKEFKKAKQHQDRSSASAKMSYYKELEDLLRDRTSSGAYKCPVSSKVDLFLQFPDKGLEDGNIPYGPVEGCEGQTNYGGRIITVKWGEVTRRISVDATAEAIKEAIRSTFGIRSKRPFWLEDDNNVVWSFDRSVPFGTYNLQFDEGLPIKVCLYDESGHAVVRTEDIILYTADEYGDYLTRNGLTGLREINGGCYRTLFNLDDLRAEGMYQGVRILRD